MNKITLIIIFLMMALIVNDKAAMTPSEIHDSLKSSDEVLQKKALGELLNQISTLSNSAVDREVFLATTRSELAPFEADIISIINHSSDKSLPLIAATVLSYAAPSDVTTSAFLQIAQEQSEEAQSTSLDGLWMTHGDTPASRQLTLKSLAQESDPSLFYHAARIAGDWQIPEAIPFLIQGLKSNDSAFKNASIAALKAYGANAAIALPELHKQLAIIQEESQKNSLQDTIKAIEDAQTNRLQIATDQFPTSSSHQSPRSQHVQQQLKKSISIQAIIDSKWTWISGSILLLLICAGIAIGLRRK